MPQIQEVKSEGLMREYAVTVPHDQVERETVIEIEAIGLKARIPGFRPGKVPMAVLRQRFGANARAEALDKIIAKATQDALAKHNLRPAVQPRLDIVSIAEGKDVEFKLAVEVLPEVPATDFSKIVLERPIADVEDSKIDEAVQRIAKGMRQPETIEGRAAAMGDVVILDFKGTVNGEARPGMESEDHILELGSKSFIDTFEDQLVGLKAGDTKKIKVTFPAAYHATELAGQPAEFAVAIKEVRSHKPIVLDDELAKEIGFPAMDKLRERIRDDLAANYAKVSRSVAKQALMDKLAALQTFAVPPSMLENEFNGIWQQVEQSKKQNQLPADEQKKSDEDLRKDYRAIAERRIRLGLLLADVAQKQKVEVSSEEMRQGLMNEARRYPGQEKAVFDYFTKTEGALEQIRAPLLEDKVVDYILSQAKVTDKKISADELFKTPGGDE